MLVRPEQLIQIVPTLKKSRADVIADRIDFCSREFKMNSLDIMEEFLPTVIHESQGFRVYCENLNYRTPEQLMKIWPKHFPDRGFALQYVRNPQKLGNYIYGQTSIAKSLGNKPEDGYVLRGSGAIQLTGRTALEAYTKYLGGTDIYDVAHRLRTDDYYAIHSAMWVFAIMKALIPAAISDNMNLVTRRINGGAIGEKERNELYQRTKAVLNQ